LEKIVCGIFDLDDPHGGGRAQGNYAKPSHQSVDTSQVKREQRKNNGENHSTEKKCFTPTRERLSSLSQPNAEFHISCGGRVIFR
jgi:hypothetical protein